MRPFRFNAGALYVHPPVLAQLTLAHFMIAGHIVRHIGRVLHINLKKFPVTFPLISRLECYVEVLKAAQLFFGGKMTMNAIKNKFSSMNRMVKGSAAGCLLLLTYIIFAAAQPFTANPAGAAVVAPTLPVLWTAGGLDAGNTGAGQAARMTTDDLGNVAIVSGPSLAVQLAIRSYEADGTFRWWEGVSPTSGTFAGDWVVAAPNGDFLAVGRNLTSGGQPVAITMVRYASNGTLLWRVDLAETLPSVGRLVVDAGGNAYLAFNSLGDGQDIKLHKYNPAGGLLWSQVIATDSLANDYATSLALGPDETDVILTGDVLGGATWITASYNAGTGAQNWLVTANEGIGARDVVADATRVYVTGMGKVGIAGFLTVVAYDRETGARLWRTDTKPDDAGNAAGLRMDIAPDGSLAVTGQAARGFLDWYTVAFETSGAVRWEAVRDGGLNTDEIPAGLVVLKDGTTVVTGPGGPNLPGGFIPGVTAGYSSDGILLWEGFSQQATVWVTALPNGDVCATGGYDALITCWRPSDVVITPTPTPSATNTPTASPTNTSVPMTATNTPTASPTNTPVPATATNTPTATPTNTPVLSTATSTPWATPTNTPVPSPGEVFLYLPIIMQP